MIEAGHPQFGLDHRVGHFRPLRIMAQVLERLVFRIVMCFRIARKQKGVADAMIEAHNLIQHAAR